MDFFKFSFGVFMILVLSVVQGSKLPPGIQKCKINAPACLKESAQSFLPLLKKGIPELGIPSFEPFKLPSVRSSPKLSINFTVTNINIFNLTTGKVLEFKINPNKKRINMIFTNTGYMKADYSANGRLLIIPIVGEGKTTFKTYDIVYNFKIYYESIKGKDGKEHWKITKHKVTNTQRTVEFEFTNLFNGNKVLSDIAHRFGNENWRELYDDLGAPVILLITNFIVENMDKVFANVPVDELFLQ